jgi:hypothetical protein
VPLYIPLKAGDWRDKSPKDVYMKLDILAALVALVLALSSCKGLKPEVTSQDCVVPVPQGSTRIFIGAAAHNGSGASFDDPLDGSTAEKFDGILSSISLGQQPTWGAQTNIAQQNLIVCLTSGTFKTNGQYDWAISKGHTKGSTLGFTVEKGWKIHGRGVDRTKLQLVSYLSDTFVDTQGNIFNGGSNVVIGTHSRNASGVEISDLTIDANHDGLTKPGGLPLNLQAIVLRSLEGGHWVHDVNVTGAAGDIGVRNLALESFVVRIWGDITPPDPQQNTGNVIDHVNVTHPGKPVLNGSRPGGAMDGIVVNNALAEVKNSLVDGYQLGYGGWNMGAVQFHDNISRNTQYGFNADSFNNVGVVVQSNQFIKPSSYGIVIGGGDPTVLFSKWTVANNTIQLGNPGAAGIVLCGQVQNSNFGGNTISAVNSAHGMIAIWSFQLASGVVNANNAFQQNQIDKSLGMNFTHDPNFNSNCRFQNHDLQGQPLTNFPDNSSAKCR